MRRNIIIVCGIVLITAVGGVSVFFASRRSGAPTNNTANISDMTTTTTDTATPSQESPLISPEPSGPPAITIDKTKSYTAVLTTTAGVIELSLSASKMPITVNNFVALSRKKFYDNTIFHRVIKGFMIQGGDPKGDGTGGPGYQFNDEPFEGDYTRGTVAMANAGPNTNGSQFFIMQANYPLPKNYVIFGSVTKGMDVVDAIANAPVKTSASGEQSSPVTPVTVTSVQIQEK